MSSYDDSVESWAGDFRAAYEDDTRNARRQTFEDYWNWVKVFLVTGGAGQRGWLEQGDEVLRGVRDKKAAGELRTRMSSLGKAIAAEWAKAGPSRRVYTTILQGSPNLRDWGKQLQRAAAADKGDGAAIRKALDLIETELRAAIGG
jgi:hypothetical protein